MYANLWNKRNFLHKKRVQLPQDLFKTPTTSAMLQAKTAYTPNRGRLSREDFFFASPTLKNLLRTKVVSRAASKTILHLPLQHSCSISWTGDAATSGKSLTPGASSSQT